MKKDITIPQGKFKIGRDIHEGVYLIAALNELSFVTIHGPNDKYEHYTLDEDNNAMMVHVEVENGDTLTIDGKVIMRHTTKFIEGDSCNLLEEIESFERYLKAKSVKNFASAKVTETDDQYEDDEEIEEDEEDEEDTDERDYAPKKAKVGFWGALGALFDSSSSSSSSSSNSSSFWSTSSKKKDNGRCDGDCSSCPAHYGYRYGRWYYGHGHSEGCVFGGNKCNGGRD